MIFSKRALMYMAVGAGVIMQGPLPSRATCLDPMTYRYKTSDTAEVRCDMMCIQNGVYWGDGGGGTF